METNILLSAIPLDQLVSTLTEAVRKEIRAKVEDELLERFLSPQEVCRLFQPNISLVTLNSWQKKNLLNKLHIGSRTYYKYSEVLEAIKSLKKYQHS